MVSGPAGLIVAANGDITWTTACTDVNVVPYDVVVQVVDGCGATDQCLLPFQLTVTNPATFDPIPPQTNYSNATYTVGFTVNSNSVLNIGSVGILAGPLPPGIASASLINVAGIGTGTVTGDIQYVVDDHCLAGGTITVEAADDCGTPNTVTGDLVVTLTNTHPVITCPANMIGLFNVTMISADFVKTDPEGDLVTVTITDVTPAPANMPTVVVDHVEWLPTLADVLLGPITVELT
ncbi:MAG: hypothetical protein KAX39_07535, partial [candidate division Zixibacteria bacterium]|nr:hypothetical protein [candidate division Zixibacteria bacterium]